MFKWGIEAAAGYVVYWAPQRPQRKVLNGISINLAVSAGLTVAPTDTQIDHATTVTTGRILCYVQR